MGAKKNIVSIPKKIVVVLGMHRSGTSAITRGLKVLGVNLGDHFLPTMEGVNAKGFWEDMDINSLNEEMLGAMNSRWYSLTPVDAEDVKYLCNKGYLLRAIKMLQKKTRQEYLFGFKDPRVAKLLPFWKEVFNNGQFDVNYVIVIRHPLSVADSLAKRDNFVEEHSYSLWLGHVIASLEGSVNYSRVFVDYDRLMQSPAWELGRIAKSLALNIDEAELHLFADEFLDIGLRHTVYGTNDKRFLASCPPLVREIYTNLLDVAMDKVQCENESFKNKIESWEREYKRLNFILILFDKSTSQKKHAGQIVFQREERIAECQQALFEKEEEIIILNRVILERDEMISKHQRTIKEREEQINNLSREITVRDEMISKHQRTIKEREEQINNLSRGIAERDERIADYQKTTKDREEQLMFLNQENEERKILVSNMSELYSYRVTSPLRFLFKNLTNVFMNIKFLQQKKFNATWYLMQNPDVAASGIDPHEHYKTYGKDEGRQPSPSLNQKARRLVKFVLHYFRIKIIYVIKSFYKRMPLRQNYKYRIRNYCYQRIPFLFRNEPSYEFWSAREKSNISLNSHDNCAEDVIDWDLFLPSTQSNLTLLVKPRCYEVDVIVPVYRGLEQTRNCINSVLNSTVTTPYRLIIINDASPEAGMTDYLRSLSSVKHIIIVENDENMGFIASVNRGMKWSDKNDVLLLNSDTETANDWLDKLQVHAYSTSKIGTVTPFSNNATICNYPTLDGMYELPEGETVRSMDEAFALANIGRNIDIPTAIGFCMYIRRDCLDDVGLFDVETFGKGYGEENDFCLRATANGWKHLLAADTFVFHEGEVSFQSGGNTRKECAMDIMRKRYPTYESDVANHVGKNEAYPLRVAATAARFKCSELPVVLHVVHAYGGGTEKHVDELCNSLIGKAKLLIMNPMHSETGLDMLKLRSADPRDAFEICFPTPGNDFIAKFLQSFGVSLLHIHHVLGYSFDLHQIVEYLGVPFYLTIHDYMLFCPRINLTMLGDDYCGEPDPQQCNHCLSADYPQGAKDIIWWREKHSWLLNDALTVICPSHDVVQRCQRYFPKANYRMVRHEVQHKDQYNIQVPTLNTNEPLRIAILGVLAKHKGLGLISETLKIAEINKEPLEFRLIGFAEGNLPEVNKGLFSQTGTYCDSNLVDMIENFNPHIILFPARWPETYSYTLTAALKSKRPIILPNIGAFPERVESRPWTWLIDWDIMPSQLIDILREIRVNSFLNAAVPDIIDNKYSDILNTSIDAFYENTLLALRNNILVNDVQNARTPSKITALVLVENVENEPGPCAYIRLILPLIRERGDKIHFRFVKPEQAMYYVTDVLITQRTAVTTIEQINKILKHCKENNIRVVYDLDDYLISLPEEHPEYAMYASKSAAVLRWLLEADEVWVSTKSLQSKISNINRRTHYIPNYIDEMLWSTPLKQKINQSHNRVVRILYMGTQTHGADLELVKYALLRLKSEFKERIEINLIGIAQNISDDKWYKTLIPRQPLGASYPAFVHWIINSPQFDIGIAPLIDNEFNRCKSEIKYLEYGALGMATVTSDLNGYELVKNGENGFRVSNSVDDWYQALKTLIIDSDLREQIQGRTQKEIFRNYSYGRVEGIRGMLLGKLLAETKADTEQVNVITVSNNKQNQTESDIDRNLVSSAFLYGRGIEVGALHNPLPVPSGVKVSYVDRLDKQGLYEHYPELRPHKLVDVDIVDNGETLQTIDSNTQDFIIANHFLEHCEDPIATLKSFARVVKTGGVMFLALPDMRATFDRDRDRTTLAHLVDDHTIGRLNSRLHHYREWAKSVEPHFGRVYGTEEEIDQRAYELMKSNYSIHFHVWQPEDVIEMLKYCKEEQKIPLDIACFISKPDEVIIVLKKV